MATLKDIFITITKDKFWWEYFAEFIKRQEKFLPMVDEEAADWLRNGLEYCSDEESEAWTNDSKAHWWLRCFVLYRMEDWLLENLAAAVYGDPCDMREEAEEYARDFMKAWSKVNGFGS